MKTIQWGIIGCGDVTEVKSGPAFNKVKDSKLVAVMRRNAERAKDYAYRHGVPKWYTSASELIADPAVNAVYIATPPSSHEEYALAAFAAGKPVYLEKPMSIDSDSAARIAAAARSAGQKLVVAHYRNAQPFFNRIKSLLDASAIGEVRFVTSQLFKPLFTPDELAIEKNAWRVNPAVAGGGLFHDLAPHQFGLMNYFFGAAQTVHGFAINQAGAYDADDFVAGHILFENGVLFNGTWSFAAPPSMDRDFCEIVGSSGSIGFSFFNQRSIEMVTPGGSQRFEYAMLEHVQQPMIEKTVDYFLDRGPNPCSGEHGALIMKWIDRMAENE
jgi:predicted dehydrogenase